MGVNTHSIDEVSTERKTNLVELDARGTYLRTLGSWSWTRYGRQGAYQAAKKLSASYIGATILERKTS